MTTPAPTRAIALLAKSARPGHVKTRLCPPLTPAEAARLHHAFVLDTIDGLRGVEGAQPVLVYTPAADRELCAAYGIPLQAQADGDLGARMHAAFETLAGQGYHAVVAIGADLPTLPAAYVVEAFALLRRPEIDVVLGPTDDGGYYLIGLRAPSPTLFEHIAWSSAHVYAETLRRAAAARLRVAALPPWWDVDTPADLARLAAALRAEPSSAPHTRAVLTDLRRL